MGSQATYETLADAYVQSIRELLDEGESRPSVNDPYSVGSDFGQRSRPTIELLAYAFTVRRPEASVVWSPEFPLRLAYAVGSFLWTVAGSDNLDWISYYNQRAIDFSDDGEHIACAFGKRLFSLPDGTDQISAIIKRLSSDRHSRRTVAVISDARDNQANTRGYPCAIGVQYFVRDDALHAITFMRSQSALKILPYDGILFMMLQQWIACSLNVALGSYTHVAGSFHIYEDELPLARRILSKPVEPLSLGLFDQSSLGLESLLDFEERVRLAALDEDTRAIRSAAKQELRASSASKAEVFTTRARLILLAYACELLNLSEQAPLTAVYRRELAERGRCRM